MDEQYSSITNNHDYEDYHSAVRKSYPSILAGSMEHYSGILAEAAKIIREQENEINELRKARSFDLEVNNKILDIATKQQLNSDRYFWLSHFATKRQLLEWYDYGQIAKDVMCDTEHSKIDY